MPEQEKPTSSPSPSSRFEEAGFADFMNLVAATFAILGSKRISAPGRPTPALRTASRTLLPGLLEP